MFKNGRVTSNKGRGRMPAGVAKAEGSAFVSGTYSGSMKLYGGLKDYTGAATEAKSNDNSNNNNTEEKKEYKETIDWIEILLQRIEQKIDDIDKKASSSFKSFSSRASNYTDEFSQITKQIDYEQQAVKRYIEEANKVGLSADYQKKVKEGLIDIETITDETLHENIKNFQEWYEKSLDCQYAITDLKEKLAEIARTKFDLVATEFDLLNERIQHSIDMLEGQLSIIENRGNFAGFSYYQELVSKEEEMAERLSAKYFELEKKRNEALATGMIDEGSEADLEMINEINEVESAWQDAHNAMLQYKNDFLDMDSKAFEWFHAQINTVTAESDFIRSLLEASENDLFVKDKGMLTTAGKSTGALHAMDYNIYMAQADEYRKKVLELNEAIAKDPNNTILIDKKNEYIQAQQESIQAAEEEKQAIKDLIEESYNRMLEALQKLIDKRKEQLEAEKDLYDYQRDIEKQTKNIANLRKQMMAMNGDDSEESRAKRQQVSESLKEAEKDLEASEYDRWLRDQEELMDKMYSEYERIFNERLDDLNGLLLDMINYANQNTQDVRDTITKATSDVGYTLTDGFQQIWYSSDTGMAKIMDMYGKDFIDQFTTVNKYIKGVYLILKEATKSKVDVDTIKSTVAPTTPAPKPNTSNGSNNNNNNNNQNKGSIAVGKMFNAGSAPIYWDAYGKVGPYGSHQYYASDPVYYAEKEVNGYILGRWYKSPAGQAAGWFKKSDITAMETGGYTGLNEGLALLHKKERVLSAKQTSAFEKLVDEYLPSMEEMFKAQSGFGQMAKQINANNNLNVTSDIDLTFNLPNVQNTEDFINEMQNNKKFEQLVQHMAYDSVMGKSSLRKNLVRTGR